MIHLQNINNCINYYYFYTCILNYLKFLSIDLKISLITFDLFLNFLLRVKNYAKIIFDKFILRKSVIANQAIKSVKKMAQYLTVEVYVWILPTSNKLK